MILKKLDRLPPFVARLLARDKKGWQPLSTSDIAARSGIPRSTVAKISKLATWATVPVGVMDKFAAACGVSLLTPGIYYKTLRHAKLAHLKGGNPQQRAYFKRLMGTRK